MPKKKTTEQFIEEARIIHNNKYDYSLTEYKNTHTKIIIICPIHGQFEQLPMNHIKGVECKLCGIDIRTQNCIDKYGVVSPRQLPEIQEKYKQTCLERYGVDNVRKSSETKQQIKQVWLKKYGVDNPNKTTLIRDKIKQTCLERYGVDHFWKSNDATELKKQTNLERYGVEYPLQSPEIQEKQKQTNLERYGCHPRQTPEVKSKQTQTNVEKYGCKSSQQKHMLEILPLINDYDWLFDQYINQNKTAQQISNELGLDHTGTTIARYLKKYEIEIKQLVGSYKCISWLESIQEQGGIHIQHALNGGEFNIPGTRLKADGFCSETNTIYEFHGDYWHGNPELYDSEEINEVNGLTMGELYQQTINREEKIRLMGYNLIVMWEYDYIKF